MADTFPALMNALPQYLIDRAHAYIDTEADKTLALDRAITALNAKLTLWTETDELFSTTRNQAIQALINEVDARIAWWDVDDPVNVPHYVEYGTDFPTPGGSGHSGNDDAYDWVIWATPPLGMPFEVEYGTPGANPTIDANSGRVAFLNDMRENIYYGSIPRQASASQALAVLSAERVGIVAAVDMYEAVYP